MFNSSRFGRLPRSFREASSKRRPTGVSRRRKKQLGFETLEDRRVMSADTALFSMNDIYEDLVSYSSNTTEGAIAILAGELERYAQQSAGSTEAISLSRSFFNDELLGDQWHLINTGQQVGQPDFQVIFGVPGEDINVAPVWNQNIFGNGVVVGVFDPLGIQTTHPDLAGNIDPTLSFDGIPFEDAHATAVAGIIGAVANNGIGGTGVAPGVTLVPMSGAGSSPVLNTAAFRFASENGVDIVNHSWGPPDGVRSYGIITAPEILALRDSIFFGRDGLGVIHVWASGNGASALLPGSQDSASFDPYVNSRYTIGVAGVDHDGLYNNVDGTVTDYTEIGASVLVAAPTGSVFLSIIDDTGLGSGIVTTDLTGEFGFNVSDNTGFPFGDRDFLKDIDYTSRFNGTSASAPIVSGVIALMLEANPNLTWRDVQEILVRSSRQNSEFASQADGLNKVEGVAYQNTWITNQVPLFHDPDLFDPLIPPSRLLLYPTLDPTQTLFGNDIHYAPTPQVLTNGAGYTVSQGRGTNGEQTGFAHGVVDAELAVLLSQQWHTKGQDLPDELTFTTAVGFNRAINLPAAEQAENIFGPNTVDLIIPGGLFGLPGFGDYWSEYLEDDPDFDQLFELRGLPLELTVPSPNDMTIETIEISVQIGGDITEFLDNVRMVLVSPSGTHSELTPYFLDAGFDVNDDIHQAFPGVNPSLTANGLNGVSQPIPDYLDAGSVDSGVTSFTFSTNRNWGERSDDAIIFDPTTAEPVIDNTFLIGGNRFNFINSFVNDSLIPSDLLTQGWQLYMENYSLTDLGVSDFEIAWHGSPIDPGTERVQGLIGIDDNQDDSFNYSRVIQQIVPIFSFPPDLDPAFRLGEVQNIIDPNHESMAANITVFAHRDVNADGILDGGDILVDQFVTGADGNYYFDLVPDDYIFSLEPASLGSLTALDDSLKPAGLLQDYQSQWAVTTDYFKVWDYDANLEVPINPATGAPFAFLDGTFNLDGTIGNPITYGMKEINFLLDPGTPPAPQVDFSGVVFADINGDGLFNGDDVAVPGVGVFGDVNRNGSLDAGEILVTTDADGEYLLTVPLPSFPTPFSTVLNVGVRPPADWTASNPDTGFQAFFVERGDIFTGVDFHIQPPAVATAGDGSFESGIILGTVFNDKNGDMIRQSDEFGVPRITVYIDMNNSGAVDAGDIVTETNDNGAYAFANVPDGSHFLRIILDPDSGISQTFPDFDLPQFAAIISGGTVTDILFGISSGGGGVNGGGGVLDYGDLPAVYGTLLADDGARHPEGIFFLGAMIDSETDGIPTSDALGDDLNFLDDEDGVVLVGGELVPDSTGTLTVTASRHGGYFQAWFDYNNDGDFDDIIDGVSEQVVVNELLDPGVNTVTFDIPETLGASTIYARFRYGEFDLGPTGLAQVGEVEDYAFNVDIPDPPLVLVHGPDFDEDGTVSGFDFLAWQRGFGMTENATAGDGDSNSDGAVDNADLADWEAQYGTGSSSAVAAATVTAQTGDLVQDGQVADTDLTTWEASYGTDNSGTNDPVAVAARAAVSSPSTLTTSNLSESIDFSPALSEAVVDSTPTSVERPDSNTLAFVASEVQRRFRHAYRFDRHDDDFHWRARIETQITETSFGDSIDLIDLGSVLRDRAVDRLFGRRDKLFDQLPLHRDHEGHETEDALETVLGEEIEWRFA